MWTNSIRYLLKRSPLPPLSKKCWYSNVVPRRALLYVPGNDTKKLNKAFGLNVDFIAMDCEDGVAINKKEEARCTIRDILDEGKPDMGRRYDLGVRVNSVQSGLFEDDLRAVLTGNHLPDTILLPKVDNADHIQIFSEEIEKYLRADGCVNLIIYVESAMAFINLPHILKYASQMSEDSQFKLAALVFGSDDFCADIGVSRSEDSSEVSYARQKLVMCAKAYNLQAIDMVYIKYNDLEGLRCQCEQGARLGFTGKQVIHPGQIPVVHEVFLPTENQIIWAEELIEAFMEHQKHGKGAFTYKGSMIDMPTVKQARNIIDLVKATKIK